MEGEPRDKKTVVGGGAVGILVRRGRGSTDGVDIAYLKDAKKARNAGLSN